MSVLDPLLGTHRVWLGSIHWRLATQTSDDAMATANYVEAGGLMSYGANFPDSYRRAATLADKVLRGDQPRRHSC